MFSMEVTRLIERCRPGDKDALGELYKAYSLKMKGVCRRYISDEQAINDVLHDAFVIIFTSFDKLRDDRKVEAWVMSITRNVASKYKDHLTKIPVVQLKEAEQVATSEGEVDMKGVPLEDVMQLVDRLPDGYGQVFRLSVFEGMSHKEIADMLGIESHSSSSQLARAKKMLRKMMRQYWAAVLLLLTIPISFFLFRKGGTTVTPNDKSAVAKQEESKGKKHPQHRETHKKQTTEPVSAQPPMHHSAFIITDSLPSVIAQAVDSVAAADTLSNMIVEKLPPSDTIPDDTTKTVRNVEVELPRYDMAEQLPDLPENSTTGDKKWSLELAYAGQLDEQRNYNQPFSYKPYIDPNIQYSPGEGPIYSTPSSIDNWSDYAVYLANNPDAVSAKTRSYIMRIALNNAHRPGSDKILRTSHHQMPVTWSLALKYRLNHRFGLESGFSYSRLTSDFEMGGDGNTIREQQTIHYLGIPMKGIYNIYEGKRWGIYGSVGLTTEIPIHSTLNSYFHVNGLYEGSDKTTIRSTWQFSTTLGLGLQFHLTPNIGFFVEPSLQYYIPMKTDIETYRTEHPFTFFLPLGIRFTW